MKKNLISLLTALLLSGCAAQTSMPGSAEPLPVHYKTPFQEATKNFERSNRVDMPYAGKRGYFS